MNYNWSTFFTESVSVFSWLARFINTIPNIVLYAVYMGIPFYIVVAIKRIITGVKDGD